MSLRHGSYPVEERLCPLRALVAGLACHGPEARAAAVDGGGLEATCRMLKAPVGIGGRKPQGRAP